MKIIKGEDFMTKHWIQELNFSFFKKTRRNIENLKENLKIHWEKLSKN